MRRHPEPRRFLSAALLCATLTFLLQAPVSADSEGERAVGDVINALQQTWNAGDMSGYLSHYHQSDTLRLTFGNTVVEGWDALNTLFRKSYPDPERMGRFTIDRLEVEMMTDDVAVATGNFTHVFPHETIKGGYSHVLTRDEKGTWIIRHERTSRGEVIPAH